MRELESFFEKQIDEHQLVVEKTRKLLMNSFLNTVNICSDSLKDNKKLLFLETGECFRCSTSFN